MTNIDDKIRKWQDAREGGGAGDLRKALGEALDQLRHQLGSETPAEPEVDLTAKHYLEVCAKLDSAIALLEMSTATKKKTVSTAALKEALGR